MDYSAESIRFLHVAYALMALGQIAYVAFLARRWSGLNRADTAADTRRTKNTNA